METIPPHCLRLNESAYICIQNSSNLMRIIFGFSCSNQLPTKKLTCEKSFFFFLFFYFRPERLT